MQDSDGFRKHAAGGRSLIVFLLAFALYLRTAAPGVTGGDSGELIAASWQLGAAHPPGYPLFAMLGRLFGFLPLGGAAFRYNLFSAAAAAGAVWLVGRIVTGYGVRPKLGWALALYLACCPLVWGTATAAEVYAPFMALLLLALYTGLKPGLRPCCLGLLLAALSMGLHYMGLAAFAALAVYHFRFRGWRWRDVLTAALAASVGLSLLVLLPLFTCREPLVNWGDPGTSGRLWSLISRSEFRQVEGAAWGWPVVVGNAAMVGRLLAGSLLWAGLLPAAAGMAVWLKRRRRLAAAWIAALVVAAAGIIFYSPPVADPELRRHVMEVFCVVPLLMAAVPCGLGLHALLCRHPAKPAAAALVFVILASAGIRCSFEFPRQTRRTDTLALDFVRNLLLPVHRGSLLLSAGDSVTFPIWYLLAAGRLRRSSLTCISIPSLTYRWYPPQLARRYPALFSPALQDGRPPPPDSWSVARLFLRNRPTARVFVSGAKKPAPESMTCRRWGLGKRVDEVPRADSENTGSAAEILRESLKVTADLWNRYQLRAVYRPARAGYVDRGLLLTYRAFLYNLGNELIESGDTDTAETCYRTALRLFPGYSAAWFNLGYLYSRTSRPAAALEAYEASARDRDYFSRATASRGDILFETGYLAGAEREYRLALKDDPVCLEALVGLGAVAYSRGQWEAARDWWRDALHLEPDNQLILDNLAILKNRLGKKGH